MRRITTIDRTVEEPNKDTWFTGRVDGRVEVGAYIPADLRHGAATLSVFWRGEVGRPWLREAVDRAESLFREQLSTAQAEGVEGDLMAFGPTQETQPSEGKKLSFYLGEGARLEKYAAYRAEFRGSSQKEMRALSIWVNVTESDKLSLGEGGENVGIAVSSAFFTPNVCEFIRSQIVKTRGLAGNVTTDLFGAITKEIEARDHL
jgi:hypothetical protein